MLKTLRPTVPIKNVMQWVSEPPPPPPANSPWFWWKLSLCKKNKSIYKCVLKILVFFTLWNFSPSRRSYMEKGWKTMQKKVVTTIVFGLFIFVGQRYFRVHNTIQFWNLWSFINFFLKGSKIKATLHIYKHT